MTVNHDGVITHLAPDTLESEVKWVLESITMNKASGGDGIPVQFSSVAQSSQTLCDPMKCSATAPPKLNDLTAKETRNQMLKRSHSTGQLFAWRQRHSANTSKWREFFKVAHFVDEGI